MPRNIYSRPFDLVSPDGFIKFLKKISETEYEATVQIENMANNFLGLSIDTELVDFNIKSTFAQLGVDGKKVSIEFFPKFNMAEVIVRFKSFNDIGKALLSYLEEGIYVGKLFARDDRRLVRQKEYLLRLLRKTDEHGYPLLLLGEEYKSEEIIEVAHENRTYVNVALLPGRWAYEESVLQFLPTIMRGLKDRKISFRKYLQLHQLHLNESRTIPKDQMLLVKTTTMSIRTLFARVASDYLPPGFSHASADLIEPHRFTGDIFEFHGPSHEEISQIPLEFYTLEIFREHFFFSDRDVLRTHLNNPEIVFKAFETCPNRKASTYIVRGIQLENITKDDWITCDLPPDEPLIIPPTTRKEKDTLQTYIDSQALYTILKALQDGDITSQGIILSSHFPSPIMKKYLMNERVTRNLKAIYFRKPSQRHDDFFSHEDRMMLHDLAKMQVDIFWANASVNLLLKYVLRVDKDFGMFVPIDKENLFRRATFFGIYGSHLLESEYRDEFAPLFKALNEMKNDMDHPKLNPEVALAISSGGGPGVMAMANKLASELGILSCAHAVDFTRPHETDLPPQEINPYIQAIMTYRLEQLIIRQSEFGLDFPIICTGGVGTDFEFALELLRTQSGNKPPAPTLLFGPVEYWRAKITHAYHMNRKIGTIRGSEWVSNTFFCVQNHKQAINVYFKYFNRRLRLGPNHPPADDGFFTVE